MCKIIKLKIDWAPDWDNGPRLMALVDHLPSLGEFRFEKRGGLYLATKGACAEFFSWFGPENNMGYSGRHFPITMKDGSAVTLKGPWSSNAQSCNQLFPETPVTEALLTDDPASFEKGWTFMSSALTIDAILQFAVTFECMGVEQRTAALARCADGSYTFVLPKGGGKFETKQAWRMRATGRGYKLPASPVVEVFIRKEAP